MNNTVFIRSTLYDLKRRYGVKLEIYSIKESTVDVETGSKSVEKDIYAIKRAILLPKTRQRNFAYDLSFIAANKNFTYGGTFDQDERNVIVDTRDLPKEYEFKLGDYAVIDNKRYNIKEVETFDHRLAAIIRLTYTQGEQSAQVISKKVSNNLEMYNQSQGGN